MVKMLIGMLIMVLLFLGGVLFGIDQASEGVTEIRGYTTSSLKEAVQTGENNQEEYQIEVMGQDFEQVSVEEKQEKFEEMESEHMTQKIAGAMEHSVKWFYNGLVKSAHEIVQTFF
ncbi:YqxA family protein [Radiobacillus kanasensis]|uniref:DUF3679 domain-containing protein n=1 Tax=Radiobacillus kanasensis TaxID=2844358 RepID=UPI001E56B1AB|nr:DUF3679 domain-containing protein [Radiobacillus kanasensis]UFT97830.1 YqxA family protein [Radiobacillus kanasensis]